MSRDRVVSTTEANPQEEQSNVALRPVRLAEYVGQPDLVERLSIDHHFQAIDRPHAAIGLHSCKLLTKVITNIRLIYYMFEREYSSRFHQRSLNTIAQTENSIFTRNF